MYGQRTTVQHGSTVLLASCLPGKQWTDQHSAGRRVSILLAPIAAHRFLKSLTGTAEYLQTNWKEFEFLHIKLGPGWQQREVQELFDTVMEVPPTAGWERPPGLGTCALETVFNLCNLIHNWIRSSERHAVVGPCML